MSEHIKPETKAMSDREFIHDWLQRNAGRTGPWEEEQTPLKNPLLTEWVLLTAWTNAEDGEPYLVRMSSENLLRTHRIGLLYDALHRWGADEEDDD